MEFTSEFAHLKPLESEKEKEIQGKIRHLTEFILQNNLQDLAIEESKDIIVKIKGIQSSSIDLDSWGRDDFNYFIGNICRIAVPSRQAPRPSHSEYDPMLADTLLMLNDKSYDYSVKLGDKTLRVHLFYTYAPHKASRSSLAMMIRVIDLKIPSLAELNIPLMFQRVTNLTSGLFLIAGHVGDGKTTTMASILNTLNLSSPSQLTVLTIENPIEYVYQSESVYFIQREVGSNVPSFKKATDDAMRENADIVVIGELRDEGEMDNALRLAEIGKLVIATIHSNSAVDTPERFVNAFSTSDKEGVRVRLKENLVGILHQNLEVVEGKQYPRVEGVLAMDSHSRNELREALESREKFDSLMSSGKDFVVDYRKAFQNILAGNRFQSEEDARRILVPITSSR